jgi:hypothetical protein
VDSNYTTQFILDCCDKYEQQEVKKIQQQSNFQLVFTDDKVYDLDKIILLRRRDVGNTLSAIHVVEKDEDNYADIMLVFLAIEHLLFNTDETEQYTYEQALYTRELRQVVNINNIISYEPYNNIADVPNYVSRLKAVLNPDINLPLLQKLYERIPSQIRERDGFIQINTNGDKNFIDVLDIFDPDDIL